MPNPRCTAAAPLLALLPALASGCGHGWPPVDLSRYPEILAPGFDPAAAAPDVRAAYQAAAARDAVIADPDDLDAIIWFGRRLGYLGRFDDAVAVYTRGIAIADDPRLRRHRGHRFLSLRRFDDAVADLSAAAAMIEGTADTVEPDGQPNARGVPTSTLHTNVWYHLGLARYCKGEFTAALECYAACLAAARNPDMEAAARYWYYLAARRAGRDTLAAEVLAPVEEGWDIIENHAYHRLLLLYRGVETRADWRAWPGVDPGSSSAAADYGLARHAFLQGREADGWQRLEALAGRGGAAFGVIAAECDLARR